MIPVNSYPLNSWPDGIWPEYGITLYVLLTKNFNSEIIYLIDLDSSVTHTLNLKSAIETVVDL
jgi:hypothetical protein